MLSCYLLALYNISETLNFTHFFNKINSQNAILIESLFVVFLTYLIFLITQKCIYIRALNDKNTLIKLCNDKHQTHSNEMETLSVTSLVTQSYQEPSFFTEMDERQVKELNQDLEPFGFAYYPKEDYFYSNMNCWQRSCGYCRLYDEACATLSMIIDCEPIYFDYDGRKWLIELWKGQYGLNTGCEIGVYNTRAKEPIIDLPGIFNGYFFECANDEDHLFIKFTLKKQGEILVTRSEKHWWLTAFKLGEFSHPKNLVMNCEITLKDQAMLNAFLSGLGRAGYDRGEYKVYGLTVQIVFDKPKTEQPVTRTPIIEYIMQTNNKNNCEAYQYATRKFDNPMDKIESIKADSPKLYRKIMNVGNSSALFDHYKQIKKLTDLKIMEQNEDDSHMNE